MEPISLTIVSVIGTLLGSLIAYAVARRKTSGRVATTEANTLWAASEKLRSDMMEQLAAARLEAAQAVTEATKCRIENLELHRENAQLRARIEALEKRT